MGSHAHLYLCRAVTADARGADSHFPDTRLAFKYGIAPAWFALFQEKDITIRGQREDDDYEVFLFTDLINARKNFEARAASLSVAIGEQWDRGVSAFKAYLNHPQASHVLLDATEYAAMFFEDLAVIQSGLVDSIRTFETPYLTGKKTLFSRKPQVSKAWRDLLATMYGARDSAKSLSDDESNAELHWFIFGSPSDGRSWIR